LEIVHVAFVEVPHLLRDLAVGLLARESGIDVRAFELDPAHLPEAVAAGDVTVLIAGPELADPEAICRLLMAHPRLKALTVIDDGRRAAFFELRPDMQTRELTRQTLVNLVRAAGRSCADQLRAMARDPLQEGGVQ
jgi:hypothetical protein